MCIEVDLIEFLKQGNQFILVLAVHNSRKYHDFLGIVGIKFHISRVLLLRGRLIRLEKHFADTETSLLATDVSVPADGIPKGILVLLTLI